MNSLWIIFITSFTVAFSGALMPGPLLSATISESGTRSRGWLVGPLYMLGHGLLEIILLIALSLGLAPFLTGRIAFMTIAFGGGGFMIWMAWGMFRSLPSLSLDEVINDPTGGSTSEKMGRLPVTGALLSLSNPYWIIWWATIGLAYVLSAREKGVSGVAAFFSGHILADTVWYTIVSAGIYKGRHVMPRILYQGLIALCALFLVGYALYLLINGLTTLLA